jgi:hypothetical protein
MSTRSRIEKLERALSPPSRGPFDGFADRMRARSNMPPAPNDKPARRGSLAWRMQQRGKRQAAADLV